MDLLARRNYSERELRTKLAKHADGYSSSAIDAAILAAREDKWLLPDAELSEQVAATLARKKKGHRYINQYLKLKGLPPVTHDAETEFEKGRALLEAKLSGTGEKDRAKARRLLANRGFAIETIQRLLACLR